MLSCLSLCTHTQYEEIREAYDLSTLMLKQEEEQRKYEWIDFEAEVQKVSTYLLRMHDFQCGIHDIIILLLSKLSKAGFRWRRTRNFGDREQS